MKPIITLCIAAFALCPSAFACSWIPVPFCETSNARPNDVVLSGKVINVDMDGIDVEVIDVLRGEEDRDTIRIWDGTDFDCQGIFSMAASDIGGLDDTVVVVMPLITAIENTWDVLGDYRRPDYFGHMTELRVINGVALGFISGPSGTPTYEMPYPDLVSIWNAGTGICSGLSVEGLASAPPFVAHMVHSMLNLTISGDVGPTSTVRILAANGQELSATTVAPGNTRIDLSGFAVGMYHIVLFHQDGTRSMARVMKL